MKLLKKILLAVDFSETMPSVVATATTLAKQFGSEILLMHAIHPVDMKDSARKMLHEVVQKELNKVTQQLEEQGIHISELIIADGAAASQIIHYSNYHNVNVILLGSGKKSGVGYFPLGVTAEKIIRDASKPVWIVKAGASAQITNILCPVDFSDASLRAVTNSVHVARKMGAKLSIVHVVQPILNIYEKWFQRKKSDLDATLAQKQQEMKKFLKGVDFFNLDYSTQVLAGDVANTIVEAARNNQVDLILMGSTGASKDFRTRLGNIAEKVVRQMPTSFVTLKSENAIQIHIEGELKDLEEHFQHGKELLEQGFLEEALAQFEHCVQEEITFLPGWQALAVTYQRLGDEKKANATIQRAKEIEKKLWEKRVEAEIRSRHSLFNG